MDSKENVIEWLTGDDAATLTITDLKMKNRCKRLAEEKGIRLIENTDGSVFVTIPKCWIKISPKRVLSPDEKKKYRERFLRNNK